jgi:hypothetical protein
MRALWTNNAVAIHSHRFTASQCKDSIRECSAGVSYRSLVQALERAPMTSSNMVCPKCKTFQPAAETCARCGVVVAKLWAQRSAKKKPKPAPKARPETN